MMRLSVLLMQRWTVQFSAVLCLMRHFFYAALTYVGVKLFAGHFMKCQSSCDTHGEIKWPY